MPAAQLTLPLLLAAAPGEAVDEPAAAAEEPLQEMSWDGTVEAGVQIREGNTRTLDLYGNIAASRKSNKHELSATASFDYAKSEGDTTRNRAFAESKYRKYRTTRSYLFAVVNAEYDEIEDLILRLNGGAGPGYKFVDTEKTTLAGEIGAGVTAEWYDSKEEGSEQETEGILWLHGEWFTKVFDRSTFSEELTAYPSVTDFGSYKLVSITSLTTPLSERLDLRVSIYDEYDSDPQVAGVKRNDLTFRATVAYRF